MAGAIGHELDQLLARAIVRNQLVENSADAPHNFDVPAFVTAAHIVGLPDPTALGDEVECPRVVLHEEPIANILSLAVDRQPLAGERVEDCQRNELLGVMIRPIIVRAVGYDDRQAVGPLPCLSEVIG